MNLSEMPEDTPCLVSLSSYPDFLFNRYHRDGIVYDGDLGYRNIRRGSLADNYIVVKKLFRQDGDD